MKMSEHSKFEEAVRIFKRVYSRLPEHDEREGLAQYLYYTDKLDEEELESLLKNDLERNKEEEN
jgi:hypothetical protein